MKSQSLLFNLGLAVTLMTGALVPANAVTYTVDPGASWVGFINVFNVGGAGYGTAAAGGYVYGSGWGTSDLRTSFAGPVLSLKANTIGDPNSFWYTPSGGPGAVGNKIMDANFYQEFTGPLAGTTVTFQGSVVANSLLGPVDAAGRGWTAVAFIKDFAPDYSSSVATTVPLNSLGSFTISLPTINDAARHVQFGFQWIGPDVWAGDPLSVPSVDVVAVPEPATAALVLVGCAGLVLRRKK